MAKYKFTKKQEKEISDILEKYPVKTSALLPLLTLVQRSDHLVSPGAMVAIGEKLDVSPATSNRSCPFIRCTTRKKLVST